MFIETLATLQLLTEQAFTLEVSTHSGAVEEGKDRAVRTEWSMRFNGSLDVLRAPSPEGLIAVARAHFEAAAQPSRLPEIEATP